MDPAMFFSMIFGSEQFEKYVGELQLAQIMKHSAGDGEDDAPDVLSLSLSQQRVATIPKLRDLSLVE